jgi:acyl-CoA synthetase (AMP-forming)/AMP-acid ligase II
MANPSSSQMNLGRIHEAIAEVIPDRECLVFRDKHFTWSDVRDRTRRLGNLLRSHGLGCHTERSELEGWESGQDHVALYLYNGNEYLEGMVGCYKARCAPFNVNYRYVEEELLYLFDNSDAKAVIFHARFAPVLEKIQSKLSQVQLWLQVADDSGNALLAGALDYEEALAQASPAPPPDDLSPDDLYILYTGGTTGMPKGVLWRQEDIFYAALLGGATWNPQSLADIQDRARGGKPIRALPSPPFMHGAAHWVAFIMWHVGGTVVVNSVVDHLDPDDIWSTVEREKANSLLIVGDAFGRPLIDQLDKKDYDLSSLFLVSSGGAILTAALKAEILERLPKVRVMDALGSSETGSQANHASTSDAKPTSGSFDLAPGSLVLNDELSAPLEPGSEETGWLAREARVPLGYYKDADKTARTFPSIAGVRYSVPGDRAQVAADGKLILLGRDSVTINSGGEKIFAEEVEQALKHHPSVYDAVVVGTPSERWGSQVTAIVQLREGQKPSEDEMKDVAREHIASYKLPKVFVYVAEVTRAPSGKADYRWAKQTATEALGLEG